MKDIPVFTSEFGIATLILREIPTKRCAYVLIRSFRPDSLTPLLAECRQFCLAAGAEQVSVSGEAPLDNLAHLHDLVEMRCRRCDLPPLAEPVALERVTAENAETYLSVYNRLFEAIPNAETYTRRELGPLIESGRAAVAVVDGRPAGIGEWQGSELRAVGVLPEYRGLGERLTLSILAGMEGDAFTLRVSSVNERALRLYRRLGFRQTRILSRWYAL